MRTLLMIFALVASPVMAAEATASKAVLLHRLLTVMGSDFPDGSPQFAAYDRNLSEADIRAALSFFESDAGRRFLSGAKEALQSSVGDLEAAIQRSKRKRTMADMRTIAVAVEAYAIDNTTYPVAETTDALGALIAPTYVRSMPRLDGWGKEYIYVADEQHYRIVSAGADGRLSPDTLKLGRTEGDFGDDIIFDDGAFVGGDS